MAKRFTDTNKYKKPFIRSLPGPYKLLWDYLYHDCDHAGIWIVDFEVAQLYIGNDMTIDEKEALQLFNKEEAHVIPFDRGKKWFIPSFVEFQYGELNEHNRLHGSVLSILRKHGLEEIYTQGASKPLVRTLQGPKDKDKNKNKNKEKEKEKKEGPGGNILPEFVPAFERWLKYKKSKGQSYKNEDSTLTAYKRLLRLSGNDPKKAMLIVEESIGNNYAGLFPLRETTFKRGDNRPTERIEGGVRFVLQEDGSYKNRKGETLYD